MQLRYYQTEAVDAAYASLCNQPGNPVIVLPTGAGKSLVIAELARRAIEQYAGRVIVLAHRKELLRQNADKLRRLLPAGVRVGLYSAGLKARDVDADVVVAGIQSAFRHALEFGARHLVLIDEVHLVPHDGEGMYRTFLDELRAANQRLRMVGLTATPWRTGEGSICRPDGLFQHTCYSAPIQKLIAEGYLSELTSRPADASYDTRGLHVRGGEFIQGEMEQLFQTNLLPACQEIVRRCADRKSVLVFCSGVNHAEQVGKTIESLTGQRCGVVVGDTPPIERDSLLEDFAAGSLRWLCNVDVLTTGFDAPNIDAIAILRATQSPGLLVQMCGRGLRLFDGKRDCLILDFGENIQRFGPIDAIDFGKGKKGEAGDAPQKTCPNCHTECGLSARECPECGFQFPREPKERHGANADLDSPILAKPVKIAVQEVTFSRHKKKSGDGPDTLRVDYVLGDLRTVSEWVCLEHGGWALKKALGWWKEHSEYPLDPAERIEWALRASRCGAIRAPSHITTVKDGRWDRVIGREFDMAIPPPSEWGAEAAEWVEDAPF